ncbi:hypothetical protein [Candidatus Endolissoclinum faulkneri]|uniref:hypothetical protein n=1 Tax=Candidatus Endolissoclinum faulkneri TaxID=1263979 RepID=UPI0002F5C557|nr:hypothetical protein [Candidatus Endolissoclinum faulkneri]
MNAGCLKQMIDVNDELAGIVVALLQVADKSVSCYSIVRLGNITSKLVEVCGIVTQS